MVVGKPPGRLVFLRMRSAVCGKLLLDAPNLGLFELSPAFPGLKDNKIVRSFLSVVLTFCSNLCVMFCFKLLLFSADIAVLLLYTVFCRILLFPLSFTAIVEFATAAGRVLDLLTNSDKRVLSGKRRFVAADCGVQFATAHGIAP